jgi:integrase/recombinase XerC
MMQFDLLADADAVARAWLSSLSHERHLSSKTLEAYQRDLQQFAIFLRRHFGNAASIQVLKTLEAADVRAFLAARRNQDVESRSLARQLSAIRSFFTYAARNGHFENTAVDTVRPPKLPHRLPRPVPESAVMAVTELADDDFPALPWIKARDAAVLTLLYGCGLRISEALSLTQQQFARRPLVVTGKGKKSRIVPLIDVARLAVQDYLEQCPFTIKAAEPMFRGAKGGVLSPRIIQLRMAHLRGALGLPESATPHALRHSFASHMLAHGADLRIVQELLGHASLSSTQVYTEVNRDYLLKQYNKAMRVD